MKTESILVIIIFFGVAGISLGFVLPAFIAGEYPQKEVGYEENSIVNYTNYTLLVPMSENVCEGCHLSGKKFIPQAYGVGQHVKGGAYCLKCHTISHERHPIDRNVTCEKCHGDIRPQIPASSDGNIVCNNCHAFPDPLLPSYGNLIEIHRPRGINCITCHTDCTRCHEQIPMNEKWNRRLKHINLFMGSDTKIRYR